MTVKAYLNPGIKSLNLSISSPTDTYSGRNRNDLSTVKVWCCTVSGFDVTTFSPFPGDPPTLDKNLVYDGLSLQVHIPNLIPNTQYYVKYALVSNIDPSPLGYTIFGELTSFVYENPTDGEFLLAGDGDGGFQNVTLGPGLSLDNNVLTTFGLAKTTESFVVMEYSGQLLNERKLTQGAGILITDDGPNNKVTISLGGLGALTSVGLEAANDFFLSISNSPLVANGSIGLGYKEGMAVPVTSGGTGRIHLGQGVLMANNAGTVKTGVAGVDYQGPTSGADVLMGNGTGGIKNVSIGAFLNFQNGVLGVDFSLPGGSGGSNANVGGTGGSTGNNTSNSATSALSSLISTLFPVLNNGIANTYPIINNGTKDRPNIGLANALAVKYGGTGAENRDNARRNIMPLALGVSMKGWVLTLDSGGIDSYWEPSQLSKAAVAQMNATAPLSIENFAITSWDPATPGGRGVNISLSGIVSIAQGGTGANTVIEARKALLPSYATKGTKFLRINREETDLEWIDVPMPQLSNGYVIGTGNQGRIDGEADGYKEPANILTLRSAYNNNNYPYAYGNILTLGGEGGNEIFVGWPNVGGVSGQSTQHANAYIRSRRDISNNWSPWTPIVTKANYQSLGMFSNVAVSGSYTDLLGKPLLANVAITGSYADLVDKPAIPATQVNSDWNATTGVSQILNKPNIPTKLSNLADVNTAGVASNQILIYNASANVWKPGNANSLISGQSASANYAETANNVAQVVPITLGGTGANTRQGALNALTGGAPLNKILRGDGTNAVWGSIVSGDLNGLSITANLTGNVNGTAQNANVAYSLGGSAVIAIINGGTGKNNRQDAINELTNNIKTEGYHLRIDATGNAKMDSIKATDLAGLTLGANVTGSAGTVTTTVGISLGGTGQVTRQAAINFLVSANATNITTGGGGGRYVKSTDGINMVMANIAATDVPQLDQNTTGSAGSLVSTYILPAIQGGTGQGGHTAFTVGDILYASSPNTLSKLAGIGVGNVLLAKGVGVAPAYGKIDLATMTTGQLPAGSGGTGATGTTGTGSAVLSTNAVLVTPNIGIPSAGVLTNVTGLPLTTGTTGVLPISKGGTNVSSVTAGALLKGGTGGTSIVSAVAGTDYLAPTSGTSILAGNGAGGFTNVSLGGPLTYTAGTLSSTALDPSLPYTWTALQIFNKSLFVAPTEIIVINTTSPNGTNCTLNAITAPIMWTTANPTANWTLNITGVSTLLATNNKSLSIVHLVSNGTPAYYQAALSIDSVAQSSVKWLGGIIPSNGNASSIDIYTFTILKDNTGSYTTIASVARYA